MPNHKLNDRTKDDISAKASQLLTNRALHARNKFPLTRDDVQNVMLKPHLVSALAELRYAGVSGLPTATIASLLVDNAGVSGLPGLSRKCAIIAVVNKGVFVGRDSYSTATGSANWNDTFYTSNLVTLDPGDLAPDTQARLASWLELNIREARLCEMTRSAVKLMLSLCVTTGDIIANWPLLARYVSGEMWRGRFNTVPDNLKRYRMEFDRKHVGAAEAVLLGAGMMPAWVSANDPVTAQVGCWRPLPSDRVFP